MPIQYAGIIPEHNWTRSYASLFDICHMGEFIIEGDPAKNNFEAIVTMNLKKMPCGRCSYGFMLNERGGIIDDLLAYRLEAEKWMVVVNAATTDKDEANFKKCLSGDYKFKNVSADLGKLDLQGPCSAEVLKKLNFAIEGLGYYTFSGLEILGEQGIISRTGYSGELGFELYLSNARITQLWQLLLSDSRVKPAGLGARDTLRLEMGYPLYGADIHADVTPLEAGLERFVDFKKDFIGKNALLEQRKTGFPRSFIYFICDSRRAARHNFKIFSGAKEIGFVTSGSYGPSLGCAIGMGYVDKDFAKKGEALIIREGDIEIRATIADKPLYKRGTARLDNLLTDLEIKS